MRTLRIACHVHLLTKFTLGGIGHKGRVARHVKGEQPSLLARFLGGKGCCLTCRVGQTVQLCLVSDVQSECLVLLQQVLRELQGEHRCLLCQLAQFCFPLLIEQSTATDESFITVVEQHFLLRGQPAVMQVYLTDALKQLRVQSHIIGMLRQDRLHLLCQCVHLVVRLGTEQVEEHRRHPVQQVVIVVTLVKGIKDGIVESGFLWVVDSLLEILVIPSDAFHESLLIVFQPDTVEGHCVMQCAVWF